MTKIIYFGQNYINIIVLTCFNVGVPQHVIWKGHAMLDSDTFAIQYSGGGGGGVGRDLQ